jgi:hypothetical protein
MPAKKYGIRNVITTADLKQKVDAQKFISRPWGTYDLHLYRGRCGYVKDETIQGRVTVFLSLRLFILSHSDRKPFKTSPVKNQ